MAINLLDMFRDVVGDQLPKQASGFLGEPTSNTTSAIRIILPAILGGLINKSESQGGTASILDFLKNEQVDGSILDNLGGMFGGGDPTNEVIRKGTEVLDFIFGKDSNVVGKVLDVVTNSSSIGRGSASSLMKMVAPVALGLIGRTVKNQGLDSSGLSSLLSSQKEYVRNAAPQGLLDKMGLSAFRAQKSNDDSETTNGVTPTSSTSKSKIGPWIILVGIALTMFFLMRSCGGREDSVEVLDNLEDVWSVEDAKMQAATASEQELTIK